MAAGQLRERITIERRQTGDDGYGNALTDTWAAVIESEPADIKPMRGDEDVIAAKIAARGLVEIRVRHSSRTAGILESDRIRDVRSGRLYNIRYIEQRDQRRKYRWLVCEYGVALG